MPKICKREDCTYPVFGGGYCQYDQGYRTDKKPKRIKTILKRSNKSGKRSTGEKVLFEAIWNSRPRKSFLTGEPLGNDAYAWFFFHILPKGKYPKFRLYDKNIILMTQQQHNDWHSKTRAQLLEKDPRWSKVFDLYDELLEEYQTSSDV